MAERILSVGNKIEFSRMKSSFSDSDEKVVYVSQIMDMDEEKITVAMPIHEGHIVPLESGYMMETYFYTAKGIYKCDCKIIGRAKEDNIYVAYLELYTELKKFQRRQYYRLQCVIDVTIKHLEVGEVLQYSRSHQMPEKINDTDHPGVIVDISGGGVRIMSDYYLEKDDYIFMIFSAKSNVGVQQFQIMGKIVQKYEAANKSGKYDYRIMFKEISTDIRDRIVKYIFEQQRLLQKKERG